jgi:hypothetical protein
MCSYPQQTQGSLREPGEGGSHPQTTEIYVSCSSEGIGREALRGCVGMGLRSLTELIFSTSTDLGCSLVKCETPE